nr:phosphatase PAP2 family protein [Sedimentibacter sp.]
MIQQIDNIILDFIYNNLRFSILDTAMTYISFLGNAGAIWILVTILLLISKKTRYTGLLMSISLILCLLIGNVALKNLVARIRPCDIHPEVPLLIPRPTDFSFPSGHTMSSFASATVLLLNNKIWGKYAVILAVLIAFSRLYLYVHYPSDILAGMIIGILIAINSVKIYKLIFRAKAKTSA